MIITEETLREDPSWIPLLMGLPDRLLNSIRVRIEHCIGWVKNWKIIGTRFRCTHQIYTLVMQVVGGLVNWQTQRWQSAKAQVTC